MKTPKVFFSSYKPKKPRLENRGQFKQLIVVVLIIVGGYFFTRLPVFQIKNIDTTKISSSEVVEELNKLVGYSILSSAVNNKIHEIQQANIEILDLHCDKGIPDTLRCRSSERQPAFNWVSSQKNYLLDREGVAYKLSNVNSKIPTIEDRANLTVLLSNQVISEEVVSIFTDILAVLDSYGFVIEKLYVEASPLHPGVVISGRREGKPFTVNKIEVKFSASYPINTQVKLLSQVIETKTGLIKGGVDLRTPGYVYYK